MTGNDPFDRQLTRGLEHLAGPEPDVDVDVVATRAARRSRRWRLPSPFRVARVGAAIVVIALFGGLLLVSGVLGPNERSDVVGASPSPDISVSTSFPPASVTFANGDLTEITEPVDDPAEVDDDMGFDLDWLDAFGTGPWRYAVRSSDPRLDGVATVVDYNGHWEHERTASDIDTGRLEGPWMVTVSQARIEIRNDQGTWTGIASPSFFASWLDEPDESFTGTWAFESVGPTILEGSAAYEGLWALMEFTDQEEPEADGLWIPAGSPNGATFEAIIVNREIPGPPSEAAFRERIDRVEQARP